MTDEHRRHLERWITAIRDDDMAGLQGFTLPAPWHSPVLVLPILQDPHLCLVGICSECRTLLPTPVLVQLLQEGEAPDDL